MGRFTVRLRTMLEHKFLNVNRAALRLLQLKPMELRRFSQHQPECFTIDLTSELGPWPYTASSLATRRIRCCGDYALHQFG
jgi:hypothetical protein